MTKKINLPITDEDIKSLNAGDSVLLTGTIITGRDAAHKRLFELIEKGGELPVDIKGELIYYVGPAPAKPGFAVGPAGPTSSYRMDKYAGNRLNCQEQLRLLRGYRRSGGAYCQEHKKRGAFVLRGFGD